MNYSDSPAHCRVDRFRSKGKWYDTFQINMQFVYNKTNIYEAVTEAIKRNDHAYWQPGFIYICLEPYHKNAFPILLIGD